MTGTYSRDRVRKFMCASACARIQNSGWRLPIVNHLPTPLPLVPIHTHRQREPPASRTPGSYTHPQAEGTTSIQNPWFLYTPTGRGNHQHPEPLVPIHTHRQREPPASRTPGSYTHPQAEGTTSIQNSWFLYTPTGRGNHQHPEPLVPTSRGSYQPLHPQDI